MPILLGTHAFAAKGDGARRQAAALQSWRALTGVRLANVQWPDEAFEVDGFRTLAVLRGDSLTATGRPGRRKPIVAEMFDALCGAAEAEGLGWFCFANSDVRVSQALVDRIAAERRDGWAVSRIDTGEDGVETGTLTSGIDTFAVRAAWWRANRSRFRGYIAGEPVWDNVFAAVLRAHGDARILNRGAWTWHQKHDTAWGDSPFAEYTRLLAALDRPYFTLWATYHAELTAMRERGATEAEEMEMQARVFGRRPGAADRIVQALRGMKARLRYVSARHVSAQRREAR